MSGRVRLMFWASLHGAASEQMPPPTRTMTWHGMLYVTVYSMVYSMLYGMVYACLHPPYPPIPYSHIAIYCHIAMYSHTTMCSHIAMYSHTAMYSAIAMYSHIAILPFPLSPYSLILFPFTTTWVTGFPTKRPSYPLILFIPLLPYPLIPLITRPTNQYP